MKLTYAFYTLVSTLLIINQLCEGSEFIEAANEKCSNETMNVTTVEYNFGTIQTFFTIAQSICRKMQAQLNDEYLKMLADMTIKNIESQNIIEFLKKQIWAIVLLVIGALFIVFLPLFGICFFCGRCCCGCCGAKRKHRNPSKCCLAIMLVMLTISMIVIVASIILYFQSMGYTIKNVENINTSIDGVSGDITEMIGKTSSDFTCKLETTISQLFSMIKVEIWALPPKAYASFRTSYGYKTMQSVIDEAGSVQSQFNETITSIQKTNDEAEKLPEWVVMGIPNFGHFLLSLKKLENETITAQKQYMDVYGQVSGTITEVDEKILESNSKVNESLEKSNIFIDNAYNQTMDLVGVVNGSIGDIVGVVKNGTDKVNAIHRKIEDFPSRQAIIDLLYIIVPIPALIIIVPSIIVILCGSLRLIASDRNTSKRPACCHFSGYVSLFAVAATFFLGWIVMLVASISFIGGYSIETICQPLFYDSKMRLFSDIPYFNYTVENPVDGQVIAINVGDVMKECKENATILSALKLNQLINADAIIKKANISGAKEGVIQSFDKIDISFALDTNELDKLKQTLASLEKESDETNITIPEVPELEKFKIQLDYMQKNISNLIDLMNSMIDNVTLIANDSLKSSEFKKEGEEILSKLFDSTVADITSDINIAKDYLIAHSIHCAPLYEIWMNTGTILCYQIGLPIQGIWASAGLMAICFIPAIILLVQISKYLFRTKEKYNRNQTMMYRS